MVAWQVATMINLWSDKKVTAGSLLGEDDGALDEIADFDSDFDVIEGLQEREEEDRAVGWLDRLGVDDVFDVGEDGAE